ncbi:hypothetical protein [Desulfurella sp.]
MFRASITAIENSLTKKTVTDKNIASLIVECNETNIKNMNS